jgi:hypothetical protein
MGRCHSRISISLDNNANTLAVSQIDVEKYILFKSQTLDALLPVFVHFQT